MYRPILLPGALLPGQPFTASKHIQMSSPITYVYQGQTGLSMVKQPLPMPTYTYTNNMPAPLLKKRNIPPPSSYLPQTGVVNLPSGQHVQFAVPQVTRAEQAMKADARSGKGHYLTRPSPSISAASSDLKVNDTRPGNNGHTWRVTLDRNGRPFWKQID